MKLGSRAGKHLLTCTDIKWWLQDFNPDLLEFKVYVLDGYRKHINIGTYVEQCPRKHWTSSWLADGLPGWLYLPSSSIVLLWVLYAIKMSQPDCPSSLTDNDISHCQWSNCYLSFYISISSKFSFHRWLHFWIFKFRHNLEECFPVRQTASSQPPAGLLVYS